MHLAAPTTLAARGYRWLICDLGPVPEPRQPEPAHQSAGWKEASISRQKRANSCLKLATLVSALRKQGVGSDRRPAIKRSPPDSASLNSCGGAGAGCSSSGRLGAAGFRRPCRLSHFLYDFFAALSFLESCWLSSGRLLRHYLWLLLSSLFRLLRLAIIVLPVAPFQSRRRCKIRVNLGQSKRTSSFRYPDNAAHRFGPWPACRPVDQLDGVRPGRAAFTQAFRLHETPDAAGCDHVRLHRFDVRDLPVSQPPCQLRLQNAMSRPSHSTNDSGYLSPRTTLKSNFLNGRDFSVHVATNTPNDRRQRLAAMRGKRVELRDVFTGSLARGDARPWRRRLCPRAAGKSVLDGRAHPDVEQGWRRFRDRLPDPDVDVGARRLERDAVPAEMMG